MKRPRLSDWFHPAQKPEIPGVYETSVCGKGAGAMQHWDGERWGAYAYSAFNAHLIRDRKSMYQRVLWRGLAENPEKNNGAAA
jgi:hypothetical protein